MPPNDDDDVESDFHGFKEDFASPPPKKGRLEYSVCEYCDYFSVTGFPLEFALHAMRDHQAEPEILEIESRYLAVFSKSMDRDSFLSSVDLALARAARALVVAKRSGMAKMATGKLKKWIGTKVCEYCPFSIVDGFPFQLAYHTMRQHRAELEKEEFVPLRYVLLFSHSMDRGCFLSSVDLALRRAMRVLHRARMLEFERKKPKKLVRKTREEVDKRVCKR